MDTPLRIQGLHTVCIARVPSSCGGHVPNTRYAVIRHTPLVAGVQVMASAYVVVVHTIRSTSPYTITVGLAGPPFRPERV